MDVATGAIRELGFGDYVLLGKNGKPIAVVEVKQSAKDAELGREQAKHLRLRVLAGRR